MPDVSDQVRDFAENLGAYTTEPGDPIMYRDPDGRFMIFLGPGSHAVFTSVFRFRLGEDQAEVQAAVDDIRAILRERGRPASTWEVSTSATPSDLADRLLGMGLVPYQDEPTASAMILDHPPAGEGGEGVEVKVVETLEDFRTSMRIAAEAFGIPRDDLDDDQKLSRSFEQQRSNQGIQFLALIDGVPVGQASGFVTTVGVACTGGSVLREHRGRGAYRALVLARWDVAASRGTPVLATNAGKMSRPILEKLGFREVAEIRVLQHDEPPAGPAA
ncbi:MAG: hypothetical protein LC722_02365 [Actinobacteria bacterium]|nr:hypothetical protein [Actinomycetota bacterium]